MANTWTFQSTVQAFTESFNDDAATLQANTEGTLQELNATIRNLTNNLHQAQTSKTQLSETLENGGTTLAMIGIEQGRLQTCVEELMTQLPHPGDKQENRPPPPPPPPVNNQRLEIAKKIPDPLK